MRLPLVVIVMAAFGCKEKPAELEQRPPLPVLAKPDAARAKPEAKVGTGSPLPEVGPHPDYPTPVRAGTDQIFLLEEPDRGPKAPLAFVLPARSSLVWREHAHCEDDKLSVTCSTATAKPSELHRWRVGTRGKGPTSSTRRATSYRRRTTAPPARRARMSTITCSSARTPGTILAI